MDRKNGGSVREKREGKMSERKVEEKGGKRQKAGR